MRRLLALIFSGFLASGCGGGFETRSAGLDFGTDVAALQPFGVAVRCRPRDSSCTDRALQMLEPMLLRLGDPYAGPGVSDSSGSPTDGSLLLVFHRDPAVRWQSTDGAGMTRRVAVDIGPYLLGIGEAYAIVDSDAPLRFVLPHAAADELISSLYLRP